MKCLGTASASNMDGPAWTYYEPATAGLLRKDTGFSRKIAGFFRKNYQIFPQTGKCTFRQDTLGYNSAVEGHVTLGDHVLSRA